MSGQLPAIADLAVIIAILCGPSLARWIVRRLDERSHDWACDCRERRQEALERHPAGTGMDDVSRVMWAELDRLAAWDQRAAEAESFSAEQDEQP